VHDERNEHERIKVVDRRRFTSGGELREGASAGAARASAGTEAAAAPSHTSGEDRSSEGDGAQWASTVRLEHLVNLLVQNALVLLQGSHEVPRSPEQARFFIDLLAVLEAKTRGNLSAAEREMVASTLAQLRSLYAQGRP
jgi:hypothetical protein